MAAQAGQHLVGLQIDHDCPTYSLTEYARFLQGLRAALPPEDLLSITALLDWFREGTALTDVVAQVDEFVPQFYDVSEVAPPREGISLNLARGRVAIAALVFHFLRCCVLDAKERHRHHTNRVRERC